MIASNKKSTAIVKFRMKICFLIVVFDFLDAQKTPEEKVATN